MSRHDHAYKNLFSHPEMVAELLRGIVRQDWVEQADWSALERVNGEHVARHRERRSSDMVWRVQGRSGWEYVYLLFEFQSRSDTHMAVRLLTYLGLLYEDLKRQGQLLSDGRLPAVLPIVLYNGLPRWRAARDVAELVGAVQGLEAYAPSLRYLLIDEGALLEQGGLPADNLATLLFRLEHADSEDAMRDALQVLIDRLQGPAFDELQRAFTVWLRDVLLPERAPSVSIPRISTLHEVKTMIVEEKIDWSLRWRKLGYQEGRSEGRDEGRQEGELLLLERLLVRRFGPLPESVRQRLSQAGTAELEAWALNVLDAKTLEDVFRP